jgi:hypothetical protein
VASRAEPDRRASDGADSGAREASETSEPLEALEATGEVPARAPSLGGAITAALRDAYYHSWRLLPANVVWAVVAVLVATLIAFIPAALLLAPVVALPTAGLFRIATRIVRGEAVSFWDAIDAWRSGARASLLFGAALTVAALVLLVNVVTGLATASPIGWAIATLAAWGLLALWLFAWTAWPILLDPRRQAWSVRGRLRLAALLLLGHPIRLGALGLVLAAFLAISTVLIVALVTVSVAFAALVASRLVLPAADRLEARLGGDARAGPGIAETAIAEPR